MEKNVYSIEEVFAGRFFKIPDYQRGYSWEKEHCEDLINDLELLPPGFNHYTGTVVFHPKNEENQDNEGSQYIGFDIVDGQQRITSIVILLHCIQLKFNQNSDYTTLSKGIEKKFLFAARLADGNPFYKLTLNADCNDYFKTNILGQPGVTGQTIRSHERLHVAKKTFFDYLEVKELELAESFYTWLIEYYSKVIQRLKVGIYVVDSATEVGVIFEVMNNRGKDLTELEKTKNYLLYITSKINIETREELAADINQTWSLIFQRFMSAGLETEAENQFLRAHWFMYSNHSKQDWEGSKSIKAKYNLLDYRSHDIELFNDLKNYITSLNYASVVFADIEKPLREGAFNAYLNEDQKRVVIFYSIKLLRTRTIASFRPLLMAVRLRFTEDAVKYNQMIQLIEKFAFRVYNMEAKRADTGQSTIFKTAYDLQNDMISFDEAFTTLKALLNRYSSSTVFNKFWNTENESKNWYAWAALKYFLYEYEEFLTGKDPVQVAWSYFFEKKLENSIEHILPQNPDAKENYWQVRFKPDEMRLYLNDLGNLCLTYNNSSYRNYGFNIKKGLSGQKNPCYANSSLSQERELTKFEEWTIESIAIRRAKLIDWAKERWNVDLSEFQELPFDNLLDEEVEVSSMPSDEEEELLV